MSLSDKTPLVSAIVSAYNSERFFAGCLDDLIGQDLYESGLLEIIAIVSGSQQNEGRIAREYLRRGERLTLITTLREPIYAAWNRGIQKAQGRFITNANCDDRHHPLTLSKLAAALIAHNDVDVVYADQFVTDTPNATWENYTLSTRPPYEDGILAQPDDALLVLPSRYCLGSQPMWRRDLHERIGLFDESFMLAGDYEFMLRAAVHGSGFHHVDEPLGLFYYADNATTLHQALSDQEARRALLRWRDALPTEIKDNDLAEVHAHANHP